MTAVTVAPEFRRIGLAERLMAALEETTAARHAGYFVDLFVRASNAVAIGMYEKFGYSVYRRVLGCARRCAPVDVGGAPRRPSSQHAAALLRAARENSGQLNPAPPSKPPNPPNPHPGRHTRGSYYSGEEDALDMRKAMPRDVARASIVPLPRPIKPEELEFD